VPLDDVMIDGADGIAVIVQSEMGGSPGPILGASALDL
jgi:hypothetical protein